MTEEALKIMVLDDEPAVAGITRMTLSTELDLEIREMHDPGEALEVAASEQFALVLTDFKMPGMSGHDFAQQLSRISPNTVVILVTAFASKEALLEVLNGGCIWRCIEKPWQTQELVSAVLEGLEKYKNSFAEETSHIQEPEPAATPPVTPHKKKIIIKKKSGAKGPIKLKPAAREHFNDIDEHADADGKVRFESTRYLDLEKIGEGGSGVLYKAYDTLLGMPVAIKFLAPDIASDESFVQELFMEARVAMQLSHKHIVRLHNIEEYHGAYYLVMEYIDGVTLHDFLNEQGAFSEEVLMQVLTVCEDAVGYAHRHQVYHRDLKPANIMINDDGVLKIIDFGLACLATQQESNGYIVGTPYYISPEELDQKPVDGRSDLFSLAVMAHELYTGELPIGPDQKGVDMHDFVPVPSSELSPELQAVFLKAWERDPNNRYPDLHSFVSAVRSALYASVSAQPSVSAT